MKQSIKSLVLSGAFFGGFMAIILSLMSGIVIGLITGIIAGMVFTLLLTLLMIYQSKKFQLLKQEMSKEVIVIYDGAANHFKGRESVGGWLFLTDKGILFRSHRYNLKNHELIIHYHEIAGVTKKNNLGLIPNGIVIQTKYGKKEGFVVNSRDIWIQKINQALQANIHN